MKAMHIVMIAVSAASVFAATQRWSYDDAAAIYSIMADGGGGCAYVRMETNNHVSVIWLTKAGQPVYQLDTGTNLPITLVNCTKKQLVYATQAGGASQYVQVAPDGTATPITAPHTVLGVPFMNQVLPASITTDAKGFFAVLIKIPGSRMTLVRFDNK